MQWDPGSLMTVVLVLFGVLALYCIVVVALSFRQGMARAGTANSLLVEKFTGKYTSAGKTVECPHCHNDSFRERQTQLNTWFLTMLSMDWLNREVTALICRKCGHVIWFSQKPSKPR